MVKTAWAGAAFLWLVLVSIWAPCAVLEDITPFQGEPLSDLTGVVFNGTVFKLPDGRELPRSAVQMLDFRNKDLKTSDAGKAAAAGGLTELAASQLENGRQLAQQFPGVAGVILVDDGEFICRPDGSNTYRYHFAALILKEEAKAWAQVVLNFEEGRSRTRLLFGHCIGADGTVQTLGEDAMKVGSPSEDASFFNATQKIVSGTIPGVEVGSVVEYAYEYEEYNPEDPRLFSPGFVFQGTEPVALSRMTVRVPRDIKLNYVARQFPAGAATEPVVEEKDGVVTYLWRLDKMPPIVAEPQMPSESDVAPRVDTSIFKEHADAYALLRALQEPRMRVTPEIAAKVAELTQGAGSEDEKIARLYHWVQENTRYISIKGSLGAGFSGHTAQETFENRYGDCTDKSILFSTMLKAIGVEAYPIIVMTNDAGESVTEIPKLSGNHCITELCAGGRDFYLDSTSENYRYPYFRSDDHGVNAFNAIRGDIRRIPVPEPEANRRLSRLTMVVDANGDAHVKTVNQYTGTIEAGVRGFWKQAREDDYRSMMSEYVNSICPGAELEDFSLSDLHSLSTPLEMRLDYTLRGHGIRAKKLMYMRVPTFDRDYPEAALETRRYPIAYDTTEQRELEVDISLPKGFRAKWLPPALEIKNPYLEYSASYAEKNGQIAFRETFRRLQRVVPVDAYKEYRDALRSIAAFAKQEMYLTEKG